MAVPDDVELAAGRATAEDNLVREIAYDSGMPASRIDEAVRRFSPEPLSCWCNGQSLESRYSPSVTPAGASGGRAAGAAVLRHQLGRARLQDAAPMPRFPVIAVSAGESLAASVTASAIPIQAEALSAALHANGNVPLQGPG